MADLLASGEPTKDTGALLGAIEDEMDRHIRTVAELVRRADALEAGTPTGGFLDRPHPAGLDPKASKPTKVLEEITEEQARRGVVFAYFNGNPTFYRSVIDRLQPGERVRNETNHGTFEYSRDEFLGELPEIANSDSYRVGPPSAPGSCRYTTGSPTPEMKRFIRAD
jgi:hypothetical protein